MRGRARRPVPVADLEDDGGVPEVVKWRVLGEQLVYPPTINARTRI
jgi:hypothetical protein